MKKPKLISLIRNPFMSLRKSYEEAVLKENLKTSEERIAAWNNNAKELNQSTNNSRTAKAVLDAHLKYLNENKK